MGRYKRYLFSGEAVPKTTLYRQKNTQQPLISRKRKKPTVPEGSEEHATGNRVTYNVPTHDNDVQQLLQESEADVLASSEEQSNIDGECLANGENNDSDASDEVTMDVCELEESDGAFFDITEEDIADHSESDETFLDAVGGDIGIQNIADDQPEDVTVGPCDQHELSAEMKKQLCPCSSTTVGEVLLMSLTLGLRHNLSWVAQTDILKMVNTVYRRNVLPATKFTFLKQFQKSKESVLYHIFCPDCEMYYGKKQDLEELINCACGKVIDVSKTKSFFLSVSIESQLKEILQDPNVIESLLTYRFQREKIRDDALEDIYDGSEYQRLFVNEGVLSNPFNFSYCFNTDGIPLGKSSNKTIWPIYLTINELPPNDRSKYPLLAGLYVGNKDPNQKIFLQPFVDTANALSTVGFNWSYRGRVVNTRLVPLCAVVDSVARWQLLNMSSFNAMYGCTFCYQTTERTIRGRRYPIGLKRSVQRTADSTKEDALDAYERRFENDPRKKVVKGVKGPTPLMLLTYFNVITGLVPDYMHALLLGVIRLHTELILESTRKKFWVDMSDSVGLSHLLAVIDKRVTNIKPPKSITRLPRSLKDAKIWKASEWRSWLIFYAVPCLHGLLKEKHVLHLSLLSSAANIILQKSVTREEISHAHNLFIRYGLLFQKYFGFEYMVYNVHLLTHIAQGVLSFGPAWTHNAFLYEGQNRYLLQLYQSPSQVALQIVRKFLVFNSLPSICVKFSPSPQTLLFCEEIVEKKLKHFVRAKGSLLVGQGQKPVLSDEESHVLLSKYSTMPSETLAFEKMFYKGMRFTVFGYIQNHKNNDAFIFIQGQNVARIERILQTKTGEVILLVRSVILDHRFKITCDGYSLTHIKRVEKYGCVLGISVENIQTQCVFIEVGTTSNSVNPGTLSFVCQMPYGCYGD